MLTRTVSLLALLWSSAAGAAENLEVQWPQGEVRTYQLQSRTLYPQLTWIKAAQNLDARISQAWIDAVVRCHVVEEVGKRRLDVECKLDDVQVRVAPVASDAERAVPIVEEMDKALTGAVVQLQYLRDGRLKGVDLEGVEKRLPRMEEQHEVLRLLMIRTFAPLDLQMPKKGSDGGDDWRQRDSFVMQLPVSGGTFGSYDLRHVVKEEVDGVVTIESAARGVISGGNMVPSGDSELPSIQIEAGLESSARFDTRRGIMLERSYTVEGVHLASSVLAEQGTTTPYVQASSAVLLEGDNKAEKLGASGLL